MWKFFFGVFPTFQEFNIVIDACTQNYECVVFNGKSTSTKIEDCIFWYKARYTLPKFTLCARPFVHLDGRYHEDRDDEAADAKKQPLTSGIATNRLGLVVAKVNK